MAERVNSADLGFEKEIFKAADKLRGNVDAAEYKNIVLGLIFLKYISDSFEERYQELVDEGDGFEEDRDEYIAENIFFVPEEARWDYIAKQATTRMFKDLYAFVKDGVSTEFVDTFFENLEKFAFYDALSQHIEGLDKNHPFDRVQIIKQLLNDKMDYGNLPKALLSFHAYENETTTPIDEQILEGEQTLNPEQVNLHFTVSEEHEELFNAYVDAVTAGKDHIEITYSFQKNETDTLAVDMANEHFVLENGGILYRPGGHGALLSNLNDMEEDIIFIKNIDNVVHQSQLEDTIASKKKLAAIGAQAKEQVDAYLESLMEGSFDLDEISVFIEEALNIQLKNELTRKKAIQLLNRPLCVCGVVKNEGEPGGGPYVVDNGAYSDLQICEKAEINLEDAQQVEILNTSEFFNPVDLVCFTKDYR